MSEARKCAVHKYKRKKYAHPCKMKVKDNRLMIIINC